MDEETLGHLIIRLEYRWNILPVNTDSDTHKHVLRCLNQLSINALKITLLKGLETEIPKVKVPITFDFILHLLRNFDNLVCDNISFLKLLHCEMEIIRTHLMDVTCDNTSGENLIIWFGSDHTNTNFSRESINFLSGNIIIHRREYLLRNFRRVAFFRESIR